MNKYYFGRTERESLALVACLYNPTSAKFGFNLYTLGESPRQEHGSQFAGSRGTRRGMPGKLPAVKLSENETTRLHGESRAGLHANQECLNAATRLTYAPLKN